MLYGFSVDERLPVKTNLFRLAIESAVLLLSPVTPHIAEEIWSELGNASIFTASWPMHHPEALVKDMLLVVVQVNGKLRSKFSVAADADDAVIEQMALSDERVQKMIGGKPVRKIVVVQKKLVNIVI
jgi:leucyl-tRNA synthetase